MKISSIRVSRRPSPHTGGSRALDVRRVAQRKSSGNTFGYMEAGPPMPPETPERPCSASAGNLVKSQGGHEEVEAVDQPDSKTHPSFSPMQLQSWVGNRDAIHDRTNQERD